MELSNRRYSLLEERTYALFGLDQTRNLHFVHQVLASGDIRLLDRHRNAIVSWRNGRSRSTIIQLLWCVNTPITTMRWWFCTMSAHDEESCFEDTRANANEIHKLVSCKQGVDKLADMCHVFGAGRIQPIVAEACFVVVLIDSAQQGVGYDSNQSPRERLLYILRKLPLGLVIRLSWMSVRQTFVSFSELSLSRSKLTQVDVLQAIFESARSFEVQQEFIDDLTMNKQFDALDWLYEHYADLRLKPSASVLSYCTFESLRTVDGRAVISYRDPLVQWFRAHPNWAYVLTGWVISDDCSEPKKEAETKKLDTKESKKSDGNNGTKTDVKQTEIKGQSKAETPPASSSECVKGNCTGSRATRDALNGTRGAVSGCRSSEKANPKCSCGCDRYGGRESWSLVGSDDMDWLLPLSIGCLVSVVVGLALHK